MNDQPPTMTAADIARALLSRLGWEAEHGTTGFPRAPSTARAPETMPLAPQTAQPPAVAPATEAPPAPSAPAPAKEASPAPSAPAPAKEASPAPSAPAPARKKPSSLEEMAAAISRCRRCGLHAGRTHVVFGEGNPHPRLVFVGEGPGRDEDQSGRPFVGAAGQLLERIIGAMGLKREDVYICNVVKCRPPNNRVPDPVEQATCGRFLEYQLELLQPEIIVALGSTAAHFLLRAEESLGRLRGRFHDRDGVRVMPTYHPAYLLRNPEAKRNVWSDMKLVMGALGLEHDD